MDSSQCSVISQLNAKCYQKLVVTLALPMQSVTHFILAGFSDDAIGFLFVFYRVLAGPNSNDAMISCTVLRTVIILLLRNCMIVFLMAFQAF